LKRRRAPSMIDFPNCFSGEEFCHFKTQHVWTANGKEIMPNLHHFTLKSLSILCIL
jgi:hypothetical protein